MKNAIFIFFDDRYFNFAFRCLESIIENYPNYPDLLICYDGINEKILNYISVMPRSKVIPYNFDFMATEALNLGPINSKKVFYRYILWTSQFDNYDSIIHLDVDTLIMGSLDELFSESDFTAFSDYTPISLTVFRNNVFKNDKLLKLLANDGISQSPATCLMLNAGVFNIPAKYRNSYFFNELHDLTIKYNEYLAFADQSAITLWCYKNNISINTEVKFNFQACFFNPSLSISTISALANSFEDIKIFHFTWWKPDSVYYRSFVNQVPGLKKINAYYHSFDEEWKKYQ